MENEVSNPLVSQRSCVRLIDSQRQEFNRAASLQGRILWVQITLAILGCVAVFLEEGELTYLVLVLTLIGSVVWAYLSWHYEEARFGAERTRRVTLLAGGLGVPIDPTDMLDLQGELPEGVPVCDTREEASYFHTTQEPGPRRLAEMLEESAFWTAFLMRKCANRAWYGFALFVCVFVLLLLSLLPFVAIRHSLELGRVVSSMLILLISADFFGAAHAYSHTARMMENVTMRLRTNKAAGYPLQDLLLVMGDYNSAVEAAPVISPKLYEAYQDKLNQLWKLR